MYLPDIPTLGQQGVAALLSLSNINFWLHAGSYWGAQAADSLLLHTWSLSVEEQFYLFFPLLLFTLLRFFSSRLVPILLFLCAASLLLFVYGAPRFPASTFYFLPTRAWELGSGCLLATLNYRRPGMFQNNTGLSLFGLIAVAISYVCVRSGSGSAPFLVLSVAGTCLIIAFARDSANAVNRMLSISPIVYIGRISYSLYVWHWPVLVLARQARTSGHAMPAFLFFIPLIFALATASYHVIERYTRQNTRAVPFILIAFLASVAYSGHLAVLDLHEDISAYSETVWEGQYYNVAPHEPSPDLVKKRMAGITFGVPSRYSPDAYLKGGIQHLYGKATPEIVLLGDSHAVMWAGVLDQIARQLGRSISFYAADGTTPFFDIPTRKGNRTQLFNADEKFAFDTARLTFLRNWKPRVVIIAARWAGEEDLHGSRELLKFLGDIGAKVFLIEQPPELLFGPKNAPQYLSFMKLKPNGTRQYIPGLNSEQYRRGRELIRQITNTCPNCVVIPVADIFLNNNNVWVLNNSDVLYIDDGHLSDQGALQAKQVLLRGLQDCFADKETDISQVPLRVLNP